MKSNQFHSRRRFLGTMAAAGVAAVTPVPPLQAAANENALADTTGAPPANAMDETILDPVDKIDLSPARWIWLPSERTLPNTFVLFRREFKLDELPKEAKGWITADSRYRLTVNGKYVQRGIAPCDPRWMDVDPLDIGALLRPGNNVIGVEVVYFGTGESMWVAGKPGLLFSLDLDFGGRHEKIVSDASWKCRTDRGHRPGQYSRWMLRALQEDFDARRHPHGWDTVDYSVGADWLPAMLLDNRSDKPSLCSNYEDALWERVPQQADRWCLRKRCIPLLREELVPALRLQESGRVHWAIDPEEWFDSRTPGSFDIDRKATAASEGDHWSFPGTAPREAMLATFEFQEEMVGYPYFTIAAPAGTIIEVSVQESHDPAKTAWLDTHWFKWMRFTCHEGINRFEAFDHDAIRWVQLHIRNASRQVTVSDVGVRRRVFPWPNKAFIRCSEKPLQRVFDAAINNLCNSTQETANEPGREREQYGGAGMQQIQGVRYAFGEYRMPQRALRTYSEGQSPEGFFLDPWPGCEVLMYLANRHIGLSMFGSTIDEGVTLAMNCWNHFLESGDRDSMREIYPRLMRLSRFLEGAILPDGLLPVEKVGSATLNVWLDDDAYPWSGPAHWRQCAFNLLVAGVLKDAIAPMAEAFEHLDQSNHLKKVAAGLEAATVRRFWSKQHGVFVDNLPWLSEEKEMRLSDRALAMSILYDQCLSGATGATLKALVERPKEMAISYPMNAIWRYRALARMGRADMVIKELRDSWATMPAVILNNTLPEVWNHQPDSRDEWCYQQVTPLLVLFTEIAGITPLAPGFSRCRIRPQLGDLAELELTAHTGRGPIHFAAKPENGGHQVKVTLPTGCEGELVLPDSVACSLPVIGSGPFPSVKSYRLDAGMEHAFSTSKS